MESTISSRKLPSGLKVFFPRKNIFQFYDETTFIYDEVQDYFKNGIFCNEGDTIFDVGANIGLFSMHAYKKYNQNINIYSFEPIPQVFEALSLNIQNLNTKKIKIFPFGLSNDSKVKTFSFHSNAPGLSSMYPNNSQEHRQALKNNLLENLEYAPRRIRRLITLVPRFLSAFFIDKDIDRIFQVKKVNCQLRRLSDVIRENNISWIDLLKIDVERSELEVLMGIDCQDWFKINQIVLEVHDIENRLEDIKNLLKTKGFTKIIIEQDPFLKASKNFNLFATKDRRCRSLMLS
jgi:FkbM family methyltransferase